MIKHTTTFLLVGWVAIGSLGAQSPSGIRASQVLLPMRDGVRLATDLFLPEGNAPFPTVLVRTPYNKSGMSAAGTNAARLGYAVVIQDTRGRFASEGENLPFHLDHLDGPDTLIWIAKQGWCNGKIGTFGGSALGITQLQLAGAGVAELACQHITVAGPDLYSDVVYTGGVFRKALAEDWLRTSQFSPKALEVWTGHDAYDRYWQARDARRQYRQVNVPAIHIGGYYDIFAQATINAFLGYQTQGGPGARGKQKLLMGPWTHGVLTEKSGDLVFPKANRPPNDVQDHVRWWDHYLKGIANGVEKLPAVTYYVMGDVKDPSAPGNVWRTSDRWPPVAARSTRWYLHGDLSLSAEKPLTDRTMTYVYDPKQPVPTIGGYQLTIPAGPKDQRPIEDRSDVVVFTSEPLQEPMEITGRVRAQLAISSDAVDTDFVVRLCDVYPDGASYNVCEGIQRARFRRNPMEKDFLKPGQTYSLKVDLWSTSIILNRGHRLRIHVTSSNAPGYDPNPNTGERLRWSDRTIVALNTLSVTRSWPSFVELPTAIQVSGSH